MHGSQGVAYLLSSKFQDSCKGRLLRYTESALKDVIMSARTALLENCSKYRDGVTKAHTLNGSLGSDVSVTLKVTFDLRDTTQIRV